MLNMKSLAKTGRSALFNVTSYWGSMFDNGAAVGEELLDDGGLSLYLFTTRSVDLLPGGATASILIPAGTSTQLGFNYLTELSPAALKPPVQEAQVPSALGAVDAPAPSLAVSTSPPTPANDAAEAAAPPAPIPNSSPDAGSDVVADAGLVETLKTAEPADSTVVPAPIDNYGEWVALVLTAGLPLASAIKAIADRIPATPSWEGVKAALAKATGASL
jgi:hypothetical protein